MPHSTLDYTALADRIKSMGLELGFQRIGIADIALRTAEQHLQEWLQQGFQGEMAYMERHGHQRSRHADIRPGTLSVISARIDRKSVV